MQGLQDYVTKMCARRLYSWPGCWVQLVMDPLHREVNELGVPREVETVQVADNRTPLPSPSYNEDVEMEDIDEEEELEGVGATGTIIRPGYTSSGMPILGYLPIQYGARRAEERAVIHFKVFFKVDDDNPMRMGTGIEVGEEATSAYHQLPEDRKNNVKDRAPTFASMDSSAFDRILGIAWVPAGAHSTKLPPTYIWVKGAHATLNTLPIIVSRSTLRDWPGRKRADSYIETWFNSKGIVPQWKVSDPVTDRRHLQLNYTPAGQSGDPGPSSQIQTSAARSDPSVAESLGQLMEMMTLQHKMIVTQQEEARKDRELQWEIIRRWAPTSNAST